MTKLTILRGVSGSGKSSWVSTQRLAYPNLVVVSRDIIRTALFGSESMHDEDLVTQVEDAAIAASLSMGRDVVVDDTNVQWKYVKRLADIGYRAGAEVEIKLFDVPLNQALANNAKRAAKGGRNVPHDVIKKQYQALLRSKDNTLNPSPVFEQYVPDRDKPIAVMVDIDGTLAHFTNRGPYDWHRVGEDTPDDIIIEIVAGMKDLGYKVIIMSGRDSVCREGTSAWLFAYGVDYDFLFMRPKRDMRKDSIVKMELFDEYVRDNYNVLCVLDDRQQVVDAWRSIGLTCLQVAPGNF